MPHHPDDGRYLHLPLVREDPNPQRRKQTPPGSTRPDPGRRREQGTALGERIGHIETEGRSRPAPVAGVQPHLVFKIPLAPRASPVALADKLTGLGVAVVSIEPDGAVIAFRDDTNLAEFRAAAEQYRQGPREGVNPKTQRAYSSTSADVLDTVQADQMRLLGPADRVGRTLAAQIGAQGERVEPDRLYVLDVELWHRGSRPLADQSLGELRRLVGDAAGPDERVRDTFVGDLMCLARVAVSGTRLARLLTLDAVAEVDLPPTPVFELRAALNAPRDRFPPPPKPAPNGPRLCVLDSGITPRHPLLENNVGHYEAVLTGTASGVDEFGHGTMVAGVAVFGDVRAQYEAGAFASEVTVFSARVSGPDTAIDPDRLVVNQMRDAIRRFTAEPHNCRVFNLSLGEDFAWLEENKRQSIWAESLDLLAREEQVLIVVSAGNHSFGHARTTSDAEAVLAGYPDYLFRPECGLNSPATAAIAVTVGGIVDRDGVAVRRGSNKDDLTRPVARPGEPSPITRVGPGLNAAVKPEFVAPAGNQLFQGFGSTNRQVDDDAGLSVMSFSHEPTKSLFAFAVGTSFAAPQVARLAALAWVRLRDALGEEPDPNLVRAVLAGAAEVPAALRELIEPCSGEDGVRRACGYGMIDEDVALNSGDRRVTLVAQGSLLIDSFLVYEVPIPAEFRSAGGRKRVIVATAFDPPVRRRRAKYLGVDMATYLIRGKSVDEIVEAYRAVTRDERERAKREDRKLPSAFQSPHKCDLRPGSTALETSTLQRSEWAFDRSDDRYGESYYLLMRADRNWAPESITHQRFGLSVSLVTEDQDRLYAVVRQRVEQRVKLRERLRG